MKSFLLTCMLLSSIVSLSSWAQVKGTFTDSRDDHVYGFMIIGNQTWMTENLTYLPQVNQVDSGDFDNERFWVYGYYGSSIDEAKMTEIYKTYGVLYNWPAATKSCPSGWHLPTDKEWQEMEVFLGMSVDQSNDRRWRTSGDVGKKLRDTTGWNINYGANEVGFNALPGGHRGYNGFESESYCGYFWTATPTNGDNALSRAICFDENGVEKNEDRRYFGEAVRCVKND